MSKKKILVVDDEAEFVRMMKTRLEANDYEVVTASDGKEAFQRIEEEKPDAVVLDIMMPGWDGLSVLKRIRRRYKTMPVFILTAFPDADRFETAKRLNASGFIAKTADLKTEIANITSVLRISEKYGVRSK